MELYKPVKCVNGDVQTNVINCLDTIKTKRMIFWDFNRESERQSDRERALLNERNPSAREPGGRGSARQRDPEKK
jgi:hypothetical protein